MKMTITIERDGKTYKVVSCGRNCSFGRKDGKSDILSGWGATHCTKGCYLPRWFRDKMTLEVGNEMMALKIIDNK